MKKNRMLRLASALLILTLLTTSVIGGTFAKYVSTGSVSDTARVAKWGVEIKTSGTLYSDAYAVATAADNKGNLPIAWVDTLSADGITVAATEAKQNIVAPGTKSYADGLKFSIAGTPEVAVKLSATIKAEDIFIKEGVYGVLVPAAVSSTDSLHTIVVSQDGGVYSAPKSGTITYTEVTDASIYSSDNNYFVLTNKVTIENGDYFPVKYTLTDKNTISDQKAIQIALDLAQKLDSTKSAPNDTLFKVEYVNVVGTKTYPANTDLSAITDGFKDEQIEWEWSYEDTNITDKDKKDTLLGDLIAARGNNVDYKIVKITTGAINTIEELVPQKDDDYTVKIGDEVVANLRTKLDISLTVTQVD